MEKRIKLSDDRVLIYKTSKGHIIENRIIMEGFIENGEVIKNYIFSEDDDFLFDAYAKTKNTKNNIVFKFDINHPLYFPLKHLLLNDNELIIDDDHTRHIEKKYLKIQKQEDIITVSYVNNLEKNDFETEKFDIFIKNILYDGRSKVDVQKKDTKKRLLEFFYEADKILSGKDYQMTFEEAIERQKILEKK